ncbi:MAG: hypothetical protein NTW33_09635 [Methanoregula sp.]|nr:hypothetical protein [Methanoregula sp.]
MANMYRSSRHREDGLSEVIGFVLILGLIVVVSSLYLAYGVPAQGRESEILHMNEVKDQFVSYKLSLDSLFNNNQVDTTVSNSFTLGTSGGFTQGTFSFIPILSPVNSGGTFAINERTVEPETLNITSYSLIYNNSVKYKVDLPAQVNYTPNHVYVNISTPAVLNQNGIFGVTVNGTTWNTIINLTPRVSFYQNYVYVATNPCPTSPNGSVLEIANNKCLVPINIYNYTRSDLTITITKGNIVTMQNYPVYENVVPGITYTLDLMDDAYGLKSLTTPPQYISLRNTLGSITATGNITYDFTEMNPYTISPIPLGSIEYRAQNNYWIPQNYYYQMGGVFLGQMEGNVTYKLPPEITFSYANHTDTDPSKNIVTVNINALTIAPDNRGVVGGNSPIQIKSTLTNITTMPFVKGTVNTKYIIIGINTTSNQSREMWKNYFGYTATVAGIPHYSQGTVGTTETFIRINGYDESDSLYDINVIASNATYATTVHGVGGIVQ